MAKNCKRIISFILAFSMIFSLTLNVFAAETNYIYVPEIEIEDEIKESNLFWLASPEIEMDENSYCEMEMIQIKGVDSTKRETTAHLKAGAKLLMMEKLMTHGKQYARSDMEINLDGKDASTQIISRSVAKDNSEQVFYPKAVGNEKCRAHVQCDSIIMGNAHIRSIPEIAANHCDANIVHEAAIGKINNDQLLKLQTLGKTEEEAEEIYDEIKGRPRYIIHKRCGY